MKIKFLTLLYLILLKASAQKIDTLYEDNKVVGYGQVLNGKRVGVWNFNIQDKKSYKTITYSGKDSATVKYFSDKDDIEQIYLSAVATTYKKIPNNNFYLEKFFYAYYDSLYNIVENGYYAIYYAKNGIYQTGTMKSGLRDGKWIVRYASGAPGCIIHYKNGILNGDWIVHYDYEEGIMIEGKYKNNARSGVWKEYYKGGKKKSIGEYNVDIPAIKVTSLNIDSLKKEFPKEEEFDSYLSNHYPYDFKSGSWKYYNEKGTLIREEKYKKGQIIKSE